MHSLSINEMKVYPEIFGLVIPRDINLVTLLVFSGPLYWYRKKMRKNRAKKLLCDFLCFDLDSGLGSWKILSVLLNYLNVSFCAQVK